MELRHLKYFLTLAEELSFRRASEKLFIAQPALSRQIKDLERDLQVRLFERTKRKVSLTDAGKYLKKEATGMLVKAASLKDALKQVHEGLVGEVSIGYAGSAMHSILPGALGRLKNSSPNITIKLYELTTAAQMQKIQSGELDIGFVRSNTPIPGLSFHAVFRENISLVLPEAHPAAGKRFKGLHAVAGEDFILFPRHTGEQYYDQLIGMCNKAGFSPRIVHETVFGNTTVRLVEAGLGVSLLPSSLESGYKLKVKFIPLKEHTELFLCFRTNETSSVVKRFIEIIEKEKKNGKSSKDRRGKPQ